MTQIMLILHVISGFLALACGAFAIFTKKGKGVNVTTGRIYFWSMVLVAVTAIYLSIVNTIPFLFLIAVFSYYLTWTGYKNIHWKNKTLPAFIYWFDAIITHLMVLFGIIMVLLALLSWAGIHVNETISSLSIVLLVFGLGTIIFAGEDLKLFYWRSSGSKFIWMYLHIGRMLGAYIGTFTAFLVVNDQFFSTPLIAWLSPTIFGTPLIFYWIRKYRLKLESEKK
ncbi:hypothetical protein [Gracilimonas halophila]|uniref:DUF2306 domain-containing protein n=1 Tax=Gracilimonas halophila TaxID=1834464 RepID=A0ABW5JMN6_9BACT